ncbi:MAG: ATP-dependent helicase [Chloroflexota bacterium]
MSTFNPRPKQAEVLDYRGGTMGVAAVPGSGKTWTLSVLASNLIADGFLEQDQEVLVVTLVNSAVNNFSKRIGEFIAQRGLLPQVGYRVRTLHGLAHDIVRERPGLVGLADDFQIIDERAAESIRKEVSITWLKGNPFALDGFLSEALDGNEKKADWIKREKLPELISEISLAFIRYAKDRQLTPATLKDKLERLQAPLPLAEMGSQIYQEYQHALGYRGAVDFDDLIRLALQALTVDDGYLNRLRERWPYILEDEAQDSSMLQENILRTLAGPEGNWVRVGDPNQAIFETFTTADPAHLRQFIASEARYPRELPNSGRSSQSIIDLANYLIDWTMTEHPKQEASDALAPPYILATPPGDPQPNPENHPEQIKLIERDFSPDGELEAVADSVTAWLEENPDKTVAVLVPRNVRGFQLVDRLKARGVEAVDSLLRSSSSTRLAAGAIANLLQYLSDPKSAKRLAKVYQVWRREDREDELLSARLKFVSDLIKKLAHVEDYLWPRPGGDWLDQLLREEVAEEIIEHLDQFRVIVRRWQGAVLLPIDQMVLTFAQDLFDNTAELATAHKLALLLAGASRDHADWRLPEMTEELAVIAKNERRFLGFSDDDFGFDPDNYKGRVVVSTMHKAKGLEWDRVYLMSASAYDFPSGQEYDSYISEKWFIRDNLNLQAEALAQLDAVLGIGPKDGYHAGKASERSRIDYVRERLRLLFVGITRAKQELVITWNTGKRGNNKPALPFIALQVFSKEHGYGDPE